MAHNLDQRDITVNRRGSLVRAASRWTFYIGPDGKILFIDRQIRTATAGQNIAAKLSELGVRKK